MHRTWTPFEGTISLERSYMSIVHMFFIVRTWNTCLGERFPIVEHLSSSLESDSFTEVVKALEAREHVGTALGLHEFSIIHFTPSALSIGMELSEPVRESQTIKSVFLFVGVSRNKTRWSTARVNYIGSYKPYNLYILGRRRPFRSALPLTHSTLHYRQMHSRGCTSTSQGSSVQKGFILLEHRITKTLMLRTTSSLTPWNLSRHSMQPIVARSKVGSWGPVCHC